MPRSTLTRRTLATGAAWAAPAVALAAAAPAFAASGPLPCTPDNCPSGDLSKDWRVQASEIVPGTGTTGYKSSWKPETGKNACDSEPGTGAGSATGVAVGEGDPSGPGGYLIYSKSLCFAKDKKVTANFQYLTYAANNRGAYMQLFIEPDVGQTPTVGQGVGGAPLSALVTSPAKSKNLTASGTPIAYTVPTTGRYLIKIVWTFSDTPAGYNGVCQYGANDIGIFNLKFTCA